MAPLIVLYPYAPVFWAIFAWASLPEWRLLRRARPSGGVGPQDAGSMRVIVAGMELALLLAFPLAFLAPAATLTRHRHALFWAGDVLIVLGSLLRRHCFRMLGDSFTGAVRVLPEQAVIERGAYRYARHPSYTAGMLMYVGFGLALTNWLSLLVLVLASTIVYSYRVSVEERALVATLGERYVAYVRRTKRFVPFVF